MSLKRVGGVAVTYTIFLFPLKILLLRSEPPNEDEREHDIVENEQNIKLVGWMSRAHDPGHWFYLFRKEREREREREKKNRSISAANSSFDRCKMDRLLIGRVVVDSITGG